MKLAVLCNKSRLIELPRLRTLLDNLYVEYKTWIAGPDSGYPVKAGSLERVLAYSSHVLCMPGPDDLDSGWLHYALGYQRGETNRLCFWIPQYEGWKTPPWMEPFSVITGGDAEIFNHYASVEKFWSQEVLQAVARSAIEDLSLEPSSRTLSEMVQKGDRFVLGLFLDAGFSPSLKNQSGVPLLNMAIRCLHIDLVGPLVDAGADLNGIADDRGTSPIMDAAAVGFDEVTFRLIGMNADLNHASRDGQTAVILAVGNGREQSAVALIRAGADVDRPDMLGMSARKYALLYNQANVLQAISEIEGSRAR